MKCLDCNKKYFMGTDLMCSITGEVLVMGREPMEVLRDKTCYLESISSGTVGGAYFCKGKLICPVTHKECREAGECHKGYCKVRRNAE